MKLEQAVAYAIRNVRKEGLTDIFARPFECDLLDNPDFSDKVAQEVLSSIKGNSIESLHVSPIEHILLPKTDAFDFRRCALIQPMDTIKYLSLAIYFGHAIEQRRPKTYRNIVHSYRFKPQSDDYIFNSKFSLSSFNSYVSSTIKQPKTKVLVKCDIANFYDKINLHRLFCILLDLNFDESKANLINELLLFWSSRDSYSIPVGSNASRIFAEAALLEIDQFLLNAKIRFCRFVDDYRLFAPDANTAHYWLTQLIDRLWLEGLTINKSKTKIEDVSDECQSQCSDEDQGENANANIMERDSIFPGQPKHPRIIAGYSGPIPTKFREATAKKQEEFSAQDERLVLSRILSTSLAESDDVLQFIRIALYSKKFEMFREIPRVLDKYPQFTPYVVDLLDKKSELIPIEIKQYIRDMFSERLVSDKYLPIYIMLQYIKLLDLCDYRNESLLLRQFQELRRDANIYIGRALIDSLGCQLPRGLVLIIRNYFKRADAWEKRAIAHMVVSSLTYEEKRPWIRNAKIQEAKDTFLVEIVDPAKAKKIKRASSTK
jgi:hypothetical protein